MTDMTTKKPNGKVTNAVSVLFAKPVLFALKTQPVPTAAAITSATFLSFCAGACLFAIIGSTDHSVNVEMIKMSLERI